MTAAGSRLVLIVLVGEPYAANAREEKRAEVTQKMEIERFSIQASINPSLEVLKLTLITEVRGCN